MKETTLPEHVNNRRRKTLTRYTILAILTYNIPVITAILAKYYDLARYDYSNIIFLCIVIVILGALVLPCIKLKKQVTKKFILVILYLQVTICALMLAFSYYFMDDLRFLILISSLLVLIFVFVQARLLISFILIGINSLSYLALSFTGITYMGHFGSFGRELLTVLIFVPVSCFIAYMCNIIQKKNIEIVESRSELKDTFSKLEITHNELESFNERMVESLRYAEMIQKSLLPGIDRLKTTYPDSMIIWMPKDIVGGDIFYTYTTSNETIIAVIDCTGHGVPGAFLTMIAYSEIRKIILEETLLDPGLILKNLNVAVKKALHQNGSKTVADDGMDAAICNINHLKNRLTFSSARIPLFYVKNEEIHILKGDKQSVGYNDSNENFDFTNHTIEDCDQCSFYIKTDGLTDQMGGDNRRRFGTNRLKELILSCHKKPFDEQRKKTLQTILEHQGSNDQIDDITLIAFRP